MKELYIKEESLDLISLKKRERPMSFDRAALHESIKLLVS